jgi:hypothetical protein
VLVAYLRTLPNALADLHGVAKQLLTREEYALFRQEIACAAHEQKKAVRLKLAQQAHCKLCSYFDRAGKQPTEQQYFLSELLKIADGLRPEGPLSAHFLQQDFVDYARANLEAISIGGIGFRVGNLVNTLYSRPIRDVSDYASLSQPLKRVVDLYYMSPPKLRAVARRGGIRFGSRTRAAFNQLLTLRGLPALDQVIRDV